METVTAGEPLVGLTEAIFLSKLHPVPSEDPAEEMGHRAANTPAPHSMAFPNRKKEGRRETEREREIILHVGEITAPKVALISRN